jgi:hypothetical protein
VAAKPDGKNASDRFVFTRPAAERISKVVRLVEGGDRDSAGLTLRKGAVAFQNDGGSEVRLAIYTASELWSVASYTAATNTSNTKTIQFAFPLETQQSGTNVITISAGGTAKCVNHFAIIAPFATSATAAQRIVVMKEAGLWRLIGAQM